jgi:hypothetical protein
MSQILGVNQSKIKRDVIHKDLLNVNGYKPNQSIIFLLINIKKNSIYNKNLLEFVDNIIICEDLDIDLNDINYLEEKELQIFEEYTHRDFWYYRIRLYKQDFLNIKKKKIKNEEPIDWHYSNQDINNFLNNLPKSIVNKTYEILQKADSHDVNSYIYIEDSDINAIQNYDASIYKKGTLLNNLYNVRDEAIGKGEVLVAYLFKNCKINGVSASFDALFTDDTRNEIKSPSNSGSYRFGTKAGVGNYNFFTNIIESRKVLKNLFNQLGEKYLKKILDPNFFELSKDFLKKGNFKKERALSSAIDAVEINGSNFNLITLWFFMAHIQTWGFENNCGLIQDVFTKDYRNSYGLVGDQSELIYVLSSLEYVKNPLKLKKDINKEIKRCFDDIDNLVIFDEKCKLISICTSSDEIMMHTISQNGIKVIEKRCRSRFNNSMEIAFKLWEKDKALDYYEMYTNLNIS